MNSGVLLLHGIARTSTSMALLARALRRAGYETLNLDYPSRRLTISEAADHVQTAIELWVAALPGEVHFVTHSMGGLVARTLINRRRPPNLGRVVMLGTPNQGSEMADLLCDRWIFRRLFGPAGADLVTRRGAALSDMLGSVDYPLGIIAGNRAFDAASWLILPKPNDGKVTVARTKVEGMADHLTLPVTHTFMMRNPAVIAATLAFLKHGRFRPAAT